MERERKEREEWERVNPELSAAWGEALREYHQRQQDAEAAAEAERIRAGIPKMLARAGVPLRCAEAALEPERTPAVRAAREWREGTGSFLLLLGGVGAGKSV